MALPSTAVQHYREGQQLRSRTASKVRSLWRRGMSEDFDLSWQQVGGQVAAAVTAAQYTSAVSAVNYMVAEGGQVGMPAELAGRVNVAAFTGVTETGLAVEEAARTAVVTTKQSIAAGLATSAALTAGEKWLTRFAMNEVTAASSGALSTAIAASPTTTGFVRMLNPPSCKECVILAGKWFRWNEGFQRHPGCDCRHVPAAESVAGDLTVDPYSYFRSLPPDEQDKLFGSDDAQAIRDGADIYRVVNVRNRGAASQSWQQRRYDSPTVTIDQILEQAGGDRAKALQLMRDNGFILEQGQVPGGALNGNGGSYWGYSAGAMGRGGARRGAAEAYRRADVTGVRDTLNPATQTAAERRFHQAYLAHEAALAGRNPFASKRPLSQQERNLIETQWQKQLRLATSSNTSNAASSQVKKLAQRLGVI